jgi:hypothetical protein
MDMTSEPYLFRLFHRDFSRSPTAHPIQPLPPKFLEATPLAASRQLGRTARFWKEEMREEG